MSILKPVCKPCNRFFRPEKNGYFFLEGMPKDDRRPEEGNAEPEAWKPYKLWVGDLWKCKGCGAEIVVGVTGGPISEHYKSNFQEALELYPPNLQVNDC